MTSLSRLARGQRDFPRPDRCRSRIWLLAGFCLLLACRPASAFSATDANTIFSSYTSAFYSQNGTNGYFKDTQTGGEAYFWGQANMIECFEDAAGWNSNTTAQAMIPNLLNGFLSYNGSSWSGNDYNDDIMWAVMAFARGGQLLGQTNYCNIAKANFDMCYARAWSTNLGGGLYWRNSDRQSKNACVNGPGAIAACLLYQIYGDTNYLTKAANIYYWERAVLFNATSGGIADNIGTNGVVNGGATTYNQGTFLGAANFLGQTNDAALAANFTMMDMTSGGILPEYDIAGNNSGFNAIFLRWMTRFMRDRHLQGTYEPWLQQNAAAAWSGRRADNLSWCNWLHPSPAGANFYSWDCISSFEALQAADPTDVASLKSVPTDDSGYWPLDAASGTIAADASGNGNDGVVSGATWNANGRVNGCLVFNGANSSVQVTNLLANDFSIAFWVKTGQTAGAGQWYNGAGLVDADVPGNANDFGTALVGSRFAFGTGNPDTTIFSTSAINDGAWHYCVATRQQVTGTLCLFVDGSLQATGATSRNTLNAPASLRFGATGGNYFNGRLDEVRVFSRALSSDEVSALYSNLLSPPAAAPASLAATAGNAQVRLSWGAAPAATSYNVKRSLIDGGPYATLTNIASTTCTDSNSVNNRTYYYVVSAVNAAGESVNSAPAAANPSPLVAWFKADAIAGLANGAKVSAWHDQTGNGCNAMQTLGASQPAYVTGAMNGLPVVRFNSGSSTYLWFYRPVQDDFTVILVYQSSQGLSTGTDFWDGAGLVNGEQNGTVNDFGTSLNANGRILAGTGNPDITIHSGTGYNNGLPHVVTFKRTRSTGGTALYVDGTLTATATAGTQSLTSPNLLVLGGQAVLNNFLTGDIAEVQLYNAALSDSDRLGQERALRCKYGLTGGLAPSVPAGLAGAAGNRQIALNWMLSAGATSYNLWRSTNNGAAYQLAASGLTGSSFLDTNAANGLTNLYAIAAADGCGASANSIALAIPLPLPALGLNAGANGPTIHWPGWADDWTLYSATNLTPPIIWTAVTNAVGSNAGQFNVTLPIGPGIQFFRLVSP